MKKILILILIVIIYIPSFTRIIPKIENILKKDNPKIEYFNRDSKKASIEFKKALEILQKEKIKNEYFVTIASGKVELIDAMEVLAFISFKLDQEEDEHWDIWMVSPKFLKKMIIDRKRYYQEKVIFISLKRIKLMSMLQLGFQIIKIT